MKIEGAIFDMDGTLLDSMYVWGFVAGDYLRSRGLEPRDDLYDKFKAMTLKQAALYYQTEYGLQESIQEIVDGVNKSIEHAYFTEVLAKDGAMEFLAALRERGVRMCVATGTDRYLAEAALRRTGLLPYFSGVLTCVSVGYGKDEPEMFEAALRHLGTPKESTWVFEDALYAVRTAQKAGFPVVGVYDKSERGVEEIRRTADIFINSYEEMGKFL